eukprot:m.164614 g.164614  ORF g.164614 m.164614 type:complete len:171 (+) comp53106_c0_seq6:384-896(+)
MTLRMRGFERTPGGSFECCVVVCRCCACLMHLLCLSDWVHSAFEEIYESGRARSIGVSNYLIPHLEELQSARVLPFVNQVEFHPQLFQKELLAYCQEKGIQVEAYSSLGTGELVTHAVVLEIAAAVQRTPAQVLLRWGLQHELVCCFLSWTPLYAVVFHSFLCLALGPLL